MSGGLGLLYTECSDSREHDGGDRNTNSGDQVSARAGIVRVLLRSANVALWSLVLFGCACLDGRKGGEESRRNAGEVYRKEGGSQVKAGLKMEANSRRKRGDRGAEARRKRPASLPRTDESGRLRLMWPWWFRDCRRGHHISRVRRAALSPSSVFPSFHLQVVGVVRCIRFSFIRLYTYQVRIYM